MPKRLVQASLVAACFALFGWRELAALRADGVTVDEPVHLAYGERALGQGTFARGSDLYNSKMPVSVLNALPVWLAERRGAELDADRRLRLARLPTILLSALLGWLVFRWSAALFGFRAGLLALFLYTFCPTVLAHSHLVTTDVATALGMFGATYAFWLFRRQPGAARLTVAAAAFGAAQLAKATAIFLVPIFVLLVVIDDLRRRRAERLHQAPSGAPNQLPPGAPEQAPPGAPGQSPSGAPGQSPPPGAPARLLHHLAPLLGLAAGFLVVVNLGFAGERTLTPLAGFSPVSRPFQALAALPVVRDLPLPVPLPYVQGLDMVARDTGAAAEVYLHGRVSRHGFWQYFLVALAIKTPLGTLALLALAAWLLASGRLRAPAAEAYLLVPALFLLVYLSLALGLQIGLRYFLPGLPFLFVLTSRVAAWRPPVSPFGALVGVLAAWTAASSLAAHPRYIPYFNELIGGSANGYRWLADSNLDWGQDGAYMRGPWARANRGQVWFDPSGPIAGRVALGLSRLVESPENAWLRDNFRPTHLVRGSWAVYDLAPAALLRCCATLPWAWPLPGAAGNLARQGQPIGGGAGLEVRLLARLNDGMLGANSDRDAARTAPSRSPVAAWFGIAWAEPCEIGRLVAYPSFYSRGPAVRRFLASDYVWQWSDGRRWLDLPGSRVSGNTALRVEHRFPPVRAAAVRLWIDREADAFGNAAPARGAVVPSGVFRAACLEIAAYPR